MSDRNSVLTRPLWVFTSLFLGVMFLLFALAHHYAGLKPGQTNRMSYFLAKDL